MTISGRAEAPTATEHNILNSQESTDAQVEQDLVESQVQIQNPWATARVFQCPECKCLLDHPIKLPCGNCICSACLPRCEPRQDLDDTLWPGTTDRLHHFMCPCCHQKHVKAGCWPDRLAAHVVSTAKLIFSESAKSNKNLAAVFRLLRRGCILDQQLPSMPVLTEGEDAAMDIHPLDAALRYHMDCGICFQLIYEPWTTPCGHTFCRHCIKRALEQSPTTAFCPACRGPISLPYLDSRLFPPNSFLQHLTRHFWSDELALRQSIVRAESPYPPPALEDAGMDIPVFVCTTSFPGMPTLLHVFEPKYREMVTRTWAGGYGGKHFGMILSEHDTIGTHLRIEAANTLPDGRSLLETKGVTRFRIKRRGIHRDGYVIADTEDLADVSLYEEEEREVAEIRARPANREPEPASPSIQDIGWMKTMALIRFAHRSVLQMSATNPTWLNSRIRAVFGECPTDPAVFPWWFGSIFPIGERQRFELLGTTSVRQRMKICCRWIINWSAP